MIKEKLSCEWCGKKITQKYYCICDEIAVEAAGENTFCSKKCLLESLDVETRYVQVVLMKDP